MLGIDKKELPVVESQYATAMREALRRACLGESNKSDKEVEARSIRISQEYEVVWKYSNFT